MRKLLDHDFKTSSMARPFSHQDEGFVPLSLDNLVPEQGVSFAVYLKTKIPSTERYQYHLCCPPGEIFKMEWARKLQMQGIKQVYFQNQEQAQVVQYLFTHLSTVMEDNNLPIHTKASRVYDATLLWTRAFFTEAVARTGEQILLGIKFVDSLFDCIRRDHYHRDWLLKLCRHDQTLYTHSVNTCLLGLSYTRFLRWSDPRIKAFGLGALLHDVGMTKVPATALCKPGPLSEEDWDLVRKHPTTGMHLLKDYSAVCYEALLMVQQHHEYGDGSGYPERLTLKAIHPWARVLRILDSYEALTARRSWRPPQAPVQALWIMRREWENSLVFDPNYLSRFIKFLSSP